MKIMRLCFLFLRILNEIRTYTIVAFISIIKNKIVNKLNLMLFSTFKTIFSDANIVIKKREIKYYAFISITSLFVIKSIAIYKFDLTQISISEKKFNDANIVIKKRKIKYFTHIIIAFIFVAKGITFYKFNLLTFIHIKNTFSKILTISFFIYRVMLSSSPIYKFYKKSYFIIADLYIRYNLLSKFRFTITRIIIVLFIILI